jgi:hypothetical protein
MIYLLTTQGIGEEWKAHRRRLGEIDPNHVKVLSHRRHADGLEPDPTKDRVIEVGFGPHNDSADIRSIKKALIQRGFPPEQIEWQPSVPAKLLPGVMSVATRIDPSQIVISKSALDRIQKAINDAGGVVETGKLVEAINESKWGGLTVKTVDDMIANGALVFDDYRKLFGDGA